MLQFYKINSKDTTKKEVFKNFSFVFFDILDGKINDADEAFENIAKALGMSSDELNEAIEEEREL